MAQKLLGLLSLFPGYSLQGGKKTRTIVFLSQQVVYPLLEPFIRMTRGSDGMPHPHRQRLLEFYDLWISGTSVSPL